MLPFTYSDKPFSIEKAFFNKTVYGSLIKTKSVSSTKADYIGVKTLNGSTCLRNDFAIGTHTLKG